MSVEHSGVRLSGSSLAGLSKKTVCIFRRFFVRMLFRIMLGKGRKGAVCFGVFI